MGQTSGQIERHITEELDQNINALQNKVKATFTWREQTCARPFTALGIALAGGILLGAFIPMPNGRRVRRYVRDHADRSSRAAGERASEVWDNIKAALISVATARLQDIFADAIPGFRDEFSATTRRSSSSATHKAPELAESAYRQRANGPTQDWSTHS